MDSKKTKNLTPKIENELKLNEITNLAEALSYIDKIEFDEKYVDWKTRVTKFLNRDNKNWRLLKINDTDKTNSGFCIISSSKEKLNEWDKKFQSKGWISSPIDINSSVQFVYFYIIPEKRGTGRGSQAIKKILENEKKGGKKAIYGFSRYPKAIPLYKRTGAKILSQEQIENEIKTYYYWDLTKEN